MSSVNRQIERDLSSRPSPSFSRIESSVINLTKIWNQVTPGRVISGSVPGAFFGVFIAASVGALFKKPVHEANLVREITLGIALALSLLGCIAVFGAACQAKKTEIARPIAISMIVLTATSVSTAVFGQILS